MSIDSNNIHWQKFRELSQRPLMEVQTQWGGQSPKKWASYFLPEYQGLPNVPMNRNALKNYFTDTNNSNESCFICCMAWGGMNRKHGAAAWRERERFLCIIQRMRSGSLSRKEAYAEFFNLGQIAGFGPAYYTKLIYFALPVGNGYIMDQWTGKAVFLLTNGLYPQVSKEGWVKRTNSPSTYESFCSFIDEVAVYLKISADEVEERMFSSGGRNKGSWRSFVLKNW